MIETIKIATLEDGTKGAIKGFVLDNGATGSSDKIATVTKMVCDFLGCTKGIYSGMSADMTPVMVRGRQMLQWVNEDPERPDEVWGILNLQAWDGKTYHFCSHRCAGKFLMEDYKPLTVPKPTGKILKMPTYRGPEGAD